MRRRTFVGLGIGVIGVPLWGQVAGRPGVAPSAFPIASPAPISGTPAASPGVSPPDPIAAASRRYAANNRFAWERIGAAHLGVHVARFAHREQALAAFPGVAERQREEAGGSVFAPLAVQAFADGSMAWAGFDDEGRPTALLAVREGRDVHAWIARQVAHAGRTPNPADALRVLVAIATSVFSPPRPEPTTLLAALPGPEDVPVGLELFEEWQSRISPGALGEANPDATPA